MFVFFSFTFGACSVYFVAGVAPPPSSPKHFSLDRRVEAAAGKFPIPPARARPSGKLRATAPGSQAPARSPTRPGAPAAASGRAQVGGCQGGEGAGGSGSARCRRRRLSLRGAAGSRSVPSDPSPHGAEGSGSARRQGEPPVAPPGPGGADPPGGLPERCRPAATAGAGWREPAGGSRAGRGRQRGRPSGQARPAAPPPAGAAVGFSCQRRQGQARRGWARRWPRGRG